MKLKGIGFAVAEDSGASFCAVHPATGADLGPVFTSAGARRDNADDLAQRVYYVH